jgi:hypothetical protein
MSEYEKLKSRIEALDDGWNKEADDILQEIQKHYPHRVDITICQDIWNTNECPTGQVEVNRQPLYFFYHSQCEKLTVFKQTLMWLLDHSTINY